MKEHMSGPSRWSELSGTIFTLITCFIFIRFLVVSALGEEPVPLGLTKEFLP
jgi:hypothetical protein